MTENATVMSIEEKMKKASTTLATMLDYLGLEANVKAEDRNGRISLIAVSEDAGRIIGVVGTRNATDYGKKITTELIRGMISENPLVVSGLACLARLDNVFLAAVLLGWTWVERREWRGSRMWTLAAAMDLAVLGVSFGAPVIPLS